MPVECRKGLRIPYTKMFSQMPDIHQKNAQLEIEQRRNGIDSDCQQD